MLQTLERFPLDFTHTSLYPLAVISKLLSSHEEAVNLASGSKCIVYSAHYTHTDVEIHQEKSCFLL